MTTVTFTPANTFKITDAQGRQLRFTQHPNGEVEVKVTYKPKDSDESKDINRVFQDKIYVQPSSKGQQLPEVHGLDTMTKEDRKMLLRGIEKGLLEVVPDEGGVSGVRKPDTVKNIYFHQIGSLTLKMPS